MNRISTTIPEARQQLSIDMYEKYPVDVDALAKDISEHLVGRLEKDTYVRFNFYATNGEHDYCEERFKPYEFATTKESVKRVLGWFTQWLDKVNHKEDQPSPEMEALQLMKENYNRPLKDSGKRREFDTGSRRDVSTGKGRFDLLPFEVLEALAKHYEKGAIKYGDENWKKGQPLSVYLDSALRHTSKWAMGMDDEDHLIAAIWNLMSAWWTQDAIRHDELPKKLGDAGELKYEPEDLNDPR